MCLVATLCALICCTFATAFLSPPGKRIALQPPTTSDTRTALFLSSIGNRVSSGEDASRYSFEEMKSMETRLENLQREAPELLCGFYESHLKSFSVRPGAVTVSSRTVNSLFSFYLSFRLTPNYVQSISVTSTCFALQAIYSTPDCSIFSSVVDLNLKRLPNLPSPTTSPVTAVKNERIPIRSVLKALLRANWRKDDMFQVPLLLYTVLKVDGEREVLNQDMDEELCHRVRLLIVL